MVKLGTDPGWAALDAERPGEPFTVRAGGTVLRFLAARDVPAGELVVATSSWRGFLGYMVVNSADLMGARFPLWQAEHLVTMYRRHYGLCERPQQDVRLMRLLDKREYREAIETDLHEIHGLDLVEEFRSRRWRRLLNFVQRIRRNSHFGQVMALDEELAKLILEHEDERKDLVVRSMTEFSVEAELLSVVADRLGELLQVQVGKGGGKARAVKPQPRPKTALAKLRERREMKHVDFTFDRLFGRVDAQGRPTAKK